MSDMFPQCPGCGRMLEPVQVTNPITHETRVMAPWVPCLDCREKAEKQAEAVHTTSRTRARSGSHKYFDEYFNR